MKKLLFIIPLFLIISLGLSAQNKYIYSEIVGMQKFINPTKLTIQIDFGQDRKWTDDLRLRDENGKLLIFTSMVDAMNWMGEMGWEFQQAYCISYQSQNVYHWLLRYNIDGLSKEEIESLFVKFTTN